MGRERLIWECSWLTKKRTSLCPACRFKCLHKYWIEISVCLGSNIAKQRNCKRSIVNVTQNLNSCVLLNCYPCITRQGGFKSCENRNESCHSFLHLETLSLGLKSSQSQQLLSGGHRKLSVSCSFDVFPSSVNQHEALNASWIPLPSEAPQ